MAGSRVEDTSSFRLNGGRYRLLGSLGRGAHCVVWRCHLSSALEPTEERPQSLALKVHIGGTDGGRQARREADALTALVHSDGLFPRLLGTVSFNGRHCLALPLHGPDLYVLQKSRGRKPFPFEFVMASAQQLLSALKLLAAANLVHADVKPQNVVLRSPHPASLDGLRLDGYTRAPPPPPPPRAHQPRTFARAASLLHSAAAATTRSGHHCTAHAQPVAQPSRDSRGPRTSPCASPRLSA